MGLRGIGRAIVLLAALGLFSCASKPQGRIMDTAEQDYVGANRADAATYDRLVAEAVGRLLRHESASDRGLGKLRIAHIGVENRGIEELSDWQEHLYQVIDTSINRSERFEVISRRFVEAALRETRLRADELFLPRPRRLLAEALETQGAPVDCLLFSELTTGTTRGEGVTQRNYLLVLEMVDLETGTSQKVTSAPIRKAYTR